MRRRWSTAPATAPARRGRWSGVVEPASPARTLVGASVGASIWQTPGGVQSELDLINSEFLAFGHELSEVVTSLPGFPDRVEPAKAPLVRLFGDVWSPLVQEWQKFYTDNKGWLDNLWWNHAPEAEQFQRKLIDVRQKAEAMGMHAMTPRPIAQSPSFLFDPTHNVFDDAGDAAKRAATDLWGIAKIALIGSVGVAGVLVLATAASRLGGSRR